MGHRRSSLLYSFDRFRNAGSSAISAQCEACKWSDLVMTFTFIWLASYFLPFLLIILSWSVRSFLIISGAIATFLACLLIEHVTVPIEDQQFADSLGDVFLLFIFVGTMGGILSRAVVLVQGWRQFGYPSIVAYVLTVAAPPLGLTIIAVSD